MWGYSGANSTAGVHKQNWYKGASAGCDLARRALRHDLHTRGFAEPYAAFKSCTQDLAWLPCRLSAVSGLGWRCKSPTVSVHVLLLLLAIPNPWHLRMRHWYRLKYSCGA